MRDLSRGSAAIGALEDGLRRSMYLYIKQQTHPVSRDEAARAAGISRKLAAFHLDKLVEKGLLRASYDRPLEREPHRAGRSSKLYQPSEAAFEVSLPERRYDLVAEVLAETVACAGAEAVACDIATRKGTAAGRQMPLSGDDRVGAAVELLARHGFEPTRDGMGQVWLRNCPFRAVASHEPEIVCRMNLAFVQGVLEGLEARGASAALEPDPGRCCIKLEEAN